MVDSGTLTPLTEVGGCVCCGFEGLDTMDMPVKKEMGDTSNEEDVNVLNVEAIAVPVSVVVATSWLDLDKAAERRESVTSAEDDVAD